VLALAMGCEGLGCNGTIGDTKGGSGPDTETLSMIGVSGARRLTAAEYAATVKDLVGETDANAVLLLPVDRRMPFDNDFQAQTASQALIEGAELIAGNVADKLDTDPPRRDGVVGCVPTGATDPVCFEHFVRTFGRRALRHKLDDAEVARFMALQDPSDFYVGVNSAVRAFLQHPEFLYRLEIGKPVDGKPGVHALTDGEIATRLSYFLIGSTPPDWLLDGVDAGELATNDGVRAAAARLLSDERARAHVQRFHALWLGWEATASADAQTETGALLDKVLFDDQGVWQDLLRSDQTYVNAPLAQIYGLPPPSGSGFSWVPWGATGRQGILSEGAFLSLGTKFSDTSPTQRGLLVRTRLFCQTMQKPPPGVNVDMPPAGADPNACKAQRYDMSTREGCKGCHAQMDPIGFGLEGYDATGAFRTTQPNRPDCPIDGQGNLEGVGTFSGPKELSELLIASGGLNECVVTELYRFAMGRYDLDAQDGALIAKITQGAEQGGDLLFEKVMLDFLSTDAFRYRRDEPDPTQP
jgi:hypothetical protein